MIKGGACLALAVQDVRWIDRRNKNPNNRRLKRVENELNNIQQNQQQLKIIFLHIQVDYDFVQI